MLSLQIVRGHNLVAPGTVQIEPMRIGDARNLLSLFISDPDLSRVALPVPAFGMINIVGFDQVHAAGLLAQDDGPGGPIPVHAQPHQTGHRADRQIGSTFVGDGIDPGAVGVQEGLSFAVQRDGNAGIEIGADFLHDACGAGCYGERSDQGQGKHQGSHRFFELHVVSSRFQ